jgi:hypothetical protein
MQTKACNLTEYEIEDLIAHLGSKLYTHIEPDETIERINYLHKRLKTFKEPEVAEVKSTNTAAGWGSENAQS